MINKEIIEMKEDLFKIEFQAKKINELTKKLSEEINNFIKRYEKEREELNNRLKESILNGSENEE